MTPTFHSHRLTYRALTPSDDSFITTLLSDPTSIANSHTSLLKPPTSTTTQTFLNNLLRNPLLSVLPCLPAPTPTSSPTTEQDTTSPPTLMPIGQIHLHPPPSESHHRKASLSINILPAHQNHGYGTEALQWVLQWGFQTAGLHRVELFCFEWNEGARRLYERVGFRLEGRRREALWFEGRWWDLLEFGLLEGEWRGGDG